jgi:hypothetical protein
MKNTKLSERRRKLLKTITVGSGAVVSTQVLPEHWVKPIVNSVLLPVHAQTSPVYSCAVTGDDDFDITINFPVVGPVIYTVTNTGTGALTGVSANIVADDGSTGGLEYTGQIFAIPNPLAAGASFDFVSLSNVSAPQCGLGGAGTITISFNSNETACEQVISVVCSGLG